MCEVPAFVCSIFLFQKPKGLKRKLEQGAEEREDFENDVKLLRKMKKGRLSKKELRDVSF